MAEETKPDIEQFLRELFKGRSGIADATCVFAVFIEDNGEATMDVAVTPPERGREMFNAVYEFLDDLKRRTGW